MERNKWLQVQMSEAERKRVTELARLYGWSASKFIRALVVHADEVRPRLVIEPRKETQT